MMVRQIIKTSLLIKVRLLSLPYRSNQMMKESRGGAATMLIPDIKHPKIFAKLFSVKTGNWSAEERLLYWLLLLLLVPFKNVNFESGFQSSIL